MNERAHQLTAEAWASYREELLSDGFEAQLLDALEEKMCIYLGSFWLGALAGMNQSDGIFADPEALGGYDGNYIEGRSSKDVRAEILERGNEILSGKHGRRLGGKIRMGRIRSVCENWSVYLSNLLEDQGRGTLIDKRLVRLIGSDFERHSQKMIIEDPKILEPISS